MAALESIPFGSAGDGAGIVSDTMATSGVHDSELGELQRRLTLLRVGLLLVVGLLGLRLWHLQIREGPYYRAFFDESVRPAAALFLGEPGTAKTSRPCSNASFAVISDPLLTAASATTTPTDRPLMIRFLLGK